MEFGRVGTTALTVVVPLAAAVALAWLVLPAVVRRRRRAGAGWATTSGTVLRSAIQIRRTGSNRHERAVVEYSYRVGDRVYEGSRIRLDDRPRDDGPGSSAARIVQRYPVGAPVQVFFDPDDPSRSALER